MPQRRRLRDWEPFSTRSAHRGCLQTEIGKNTETASSRCVDRSRLAGTPSARYHAAKTHNSRGAVAPQATLDRWHE